MKHYEKKLAQLEARTLRLANELNELNRDALELAREPSLAEESIATVRDLEAWTRRAENELRGKYTNVFHCVPVEDEPVLF